MAWLIFDVGQIMDAPSARQEALLKYLGLVVPATYEEASALISHSKRDEALVQRWRTWSTDRLFVFPELYEEELASFKEGRAKILYRQAKGNSYDYRPAPNSTVAMCEAAVAFLDAQRPNWDYTVFANDLESIDAFEPIFLGALAQVHPEAFRKSDIDRYRRLLPARSSRIFRTLNNQRGDVIKSGLSPVDPTSAQVLVPKRRWWEFWK